MAKLGGEKYMADEETKERVSSEGGKASHGGGRKGEEYHQDIGNQGRGSNLTEEDRSKGGKHSHGGGR